MMEDVQLHSPLVFSEKDSENGTGEEGRRVQVVLDDSEQGSSRCVQIYSIGPSKEWTMHVEGRVSPGAPLPEAGGRTDLEGLKARLSPADVSAYYRAKADTGVDLGPFFRTLGMCWSGPGEALGEVFLPEALGRNQLDVHPLLLDGCFQVVGLARNMTGAPGEATYLPFGWDRLWLSQNLPDRVFCHVRMSDTYQGADEVPEILSGELRIYDPHGVLLGDFSGYTVKRATREALLSAVEGVDDLLYEVTWRECALESALMPADFFPGPASVAAGCAAVYRLLGERWRRSTGQECLAGGPGAMVLGPRSRDIGGVRLAACQGRFRGPRESAATAGRPAGAQSSIPPHARNGCQVRGARGDRWRLCSGRRPRGPVA